MVTRVASSLPKHLMLRAQVRAGLTGTGLVAGVAILLSGFFTISLFWYLGDWPRDVPGLWEYRSATIGDAVLLPVAAGLLVSIGSRLNPAPGERNILTLAWGLGAAVGMVVQVLWLRDPDPQLNWTVPSPHNFNAPGIYHSVFFVVASGLFTSWMVRLQWRLRLASIRSPEELESLARSPITALLVACLVGFAGLVALDGVYIEGYSTPSTWTSASATVAAAASMLFTNAAFCWSLGRRVVIRSWSTFAWAAILAVALWAASWRPSIVSQLAPSQLLAFVAVATGLAIIFWLLKSRQHYWWIQMLSSWLFLLGGMNFI